MNYELFKQFKAQHNFKKLYHKRSDLTSFILQEYEKLRMRQNPMLQQRAQVGGRSMPAWFASSLVNQSRIGAPSPPPPPLPAEPPPVESDYEEIDHLPKNQMKKNSKFQIK